MSKKMVSWSLMPVTVFMVEIRDGFDVSTRSNIFPESIAGGSFIILTSPNSPTISVSSLCFAAVWHLRFRLIPHIFVVTYLYSPQFELR